MPQVYIIGGTNGAGKTTSALTMLPDLLQCDEYVNADAIAAGLSPFHPEKSAFQAGRLMLKQLHYLRDQCKDFAFETTMASITFVKFLQECKNLGYTVNAVFFYLESVELAKERVKFRVANGGHDIPVEVIERRYHSGLNNFFNLYLPISDYWKVYNNSHDHPQLIAEKNKLGAITFGDEKLWGDLRSQAYERTK